MPPEYELKFCTSADSANVSAMIKAVYRGYSEYGDFVEMLMGGAHPTARAWHTIAAFESASGKAVSAICCNPQEWRYAGLRLPVLNLSIVGTLPEHRGRGLIRRVINSVHEWADREGFLACAVIGRPWFYRHFGYSYALPTSEGKQVSNASARSLIDPGKAARFSARPVRLDDLHFLACLHQEAIRRYLLSFPYDEGYWKLSVFEYYERNRDQYRILETRQGAPVGVIGHASFSGNAFDILQWEIIGGVSWLDTAPAVLDYLISTGEALAGKGGEACRSLALHLGPGHPIYPLLEGIEQIDLPVGRHHLRIGDLPRFLEYIAPVLEARLEASILVGYTRQVHVELFGQKDGLEITFEGGKLVSIRAEQRDYDFNPGEIQIPTEQLLELIMGIRSIDEMLGHFREVNSWNSESGLNTEMKVLLRTLFPKLISHLYACV
jgi:predicted N-acetyltransferase YhbS